jgi:2-C-methyl-D-erythritol 4-phosphate cytidylyltransferase
MVDSSSKYRNTCILLSGGVGARLGASTPKQYIEVNDKPILEYTLNAVKAWKTMDSLIIVADRQWWEYIDDMVRGVLSEEIRELGIQSRSCENFGFLGFAEPGKNRQLSIYNALRAIKDYMGKDAVVMIHDGVRPCLSSGLIDRCDSVLNTRNNVQVCNDGVMPYLEVKDTVYIKDADGNISGMLDRGSLAAGQTPEFFNYWKYLKANEDLSEDEMLLINGSTEPAVKAGMKIALVPGEESNFKITTPEDLERFKRMAEG